MASESTNQVGVWVSERDKNDLEELAWQRRTSMSDIVRGLVQDELENARRTGEIDTPDEAHAHS